MSLNPDLPLTTERLVLRKFTKSDYPAFAAYRSRPDIYRYLYADAPDGKALQQMFAKLLRPAFKQDGDVFKLAVIRRDDDALLGEVLLKHESKDALQGEVGYIFNPAYAGRGYATEAVAAMIGIGFSSFGLHRVFARLDSQNKGSVGVVERLGLRREAHLVENDRFNGAWGDEYIYAVLAREWNARQA